ncbi:hypothetical protein Dimus_016556 [Dionaea muscipula]
MVDNWEHQYGKFHSRRTTIMCNFHITCTKSKTKEEKIKDKLGQLATGNLRICQKLSIREAVENKGGKKSNTITPNSQINKIKEQSAKREVKFPPEQSVGGRRI